MAVVYHIKTCLLFLNVYKICKFSPIFVYCIVKFKPQQEIKQMKIWSQRKKLSQKKIRNQRKKLREKKTMLTYLVS